MRIPRTEKASMEKVSIICFANVFMGREPSQGLQSLGEIVGRKEGGEMSRPCKAVFSGAWRPRRRGHWVPQEAFPRESSRLSGGATALRRRHGGLRECASLGPAKSSSRSGRDGSGKSIIFLPCHHRPDAPRHRSLQRFTEIFSAMRNHFVPPHSRRSAIATHLHRLAATAEWKSVTLAAA